MSVTVASHMRYDKVTLWLDCPFEFQFARKNTFFSLCEQEKNTYSCIFTGIVSFISVTVFGSSFLQYIRITSE